MIRWRAPLRCVVILAAVCGLFVTSSCVKDRPLSAPLGPATVLGSTPPATSSTPTPSVPSVGGGELTQALAVFCTNTSLAQRQASLAGPIVDPTDIQEFSRTVGAAWTTETETLSLLTPPADLAEPFARFLANARAMAAARSVLATDPASAAANAKLDSLFTARRPLAKALGARRCDGDLSGPQEQAVVEATRAFITSVDPAQGCGALVTATFVATQFVKLADPAAACTAEVLRLANNPGLRATDIATTEISGTEGISATVEFVEVGGCCAGVPTTARLYFIDGEWKIHSMRYR